MNFSKELKTGAITLGFLFLGTFVSANHPTAKTLNAKEIVKKMDKNKDGQLSKKEVSGSLKSNFTKIDTNKNGFLSIKEVEKVQNKNLNKKKK